MQGEYDLVNELGSGNWIDVVSGEAVVMGHAGGDPELVVLGTSLAKMVQEIKYNDDKFSLVEAAAIYLGNKIKERKSRDKYSIFIDEIFEGDEKHKPLDRWEYDLILGDGRYEIKMMLPVYDKYTLVDNRKIRAEKAVMECFEDPSFRVYKKIEQIVDYTTQVFKYTSFYDKEGKLIRRTIDHDHEGGFYRGWVDMFFFDKFEDAWNAWNKVKDAYYQKD